MWSVTGKYHHGQKTAFHLQIGKGRGQQSINNHLRVHGPEYNFLYQLFLLVLANKEVACGGE